MKTMKKIVAILAVALLLCSMLPLSVMAADTTITFEFGANGSATHKDGSDSTADSTYSETVDGYTLSITNGTNMYNGAYDAKGNSCIKLGTSSKSGSFKFTVPSDVTSVIINIAAYKAKTATVTINGTATALSTKSDNGQYDAITVDTTATKEVSLAVTSGYRAMVNSITYVISAPASADCEHDKLVCGDTCGECEEYVKEHKFSNACVEKCENGCGVTNPDYTGHTYTSDYDATCNTCYAVRTDSMLPAEGEALSLELAIAIGAGQDKNNYTAQKYYITGIIVDTYKDTWATYGNFYIEDAEGNRFLIYGLYSIDGKIRYDAMEYKPNVSDEITVYGAIGNYNGTPQMQSGWLHEVVQNCSHDWDNACDTDCNLGCGYTREPKHNYVEDIIESTCTEHGTATYECSVCFDSYDEELPLAAHNYVNDICSACGAIKPAGYAPITSADQFVSGQYILVVETGYAPTYVNDANKPWLLCGQPVITDGIISADDAAGFLLTVTVDGSTVKIQDANGNYIAPTGTETNGIKIGEYDWTWSFENGEFIFAGDKVYLASNTSTGDTGGLNRFRAYKQSTCTGTSGTSYKYKFTLYAASTPSQPEEPACEHEYEYDCSKICALCGEETRPEAEHQFFNSCETVCVICYQEVREASHTIVHVAGVEPTCAAMGNLEYWACEVCGAAWLDEACTLNTNRFAVILPTTEDHVYDDEYDADCNVCGATREVPAKPTEIIYGDADGDGEITLVDVALLQQYTNGWDVTVDETAADVDGDGEISLVDVALLQQYTNGWEVTLGPKKIYNDGELSDWQAQ